MFMMADAMAWQHVTVRHCHKEGNCGVFVNAPRRATFVEVFLIGCTLLVLPLFEAPKNILSVMFVITWIYQACKQSRLGQSSSFDFPLLVLVLVLWIAPFTSTVAISLDSGLRWTLMGVFVLLALRLNFDARQLALITSMLLLGGIFAVAESLVVWNFNGKPFPEFRSVGHVNHSSMYTMIVAGAAFGGLLHLDTRVRLLSLIALAAVILFMVPSRSVVGVLTFGSLALVWFFLCFSSRWQYQRSWMVFLLAALCFCLLFLLPWASSFRAEILARLWGDDFFSGRIQIWRSAMAVWHLNFWFGSGWFSFGAATSEAAVKLALGANFEAYQPDYYWHYPHGHNLWVTMLVERGVVGLAAVCALLFLYLRYFLQNLLVDGNSSIETFASASGLLISLAFMVGGFGNTTMINEHGHAGMAFIAVAYGYLRGRGIIHSSKCQPQ
jgi:O-antigen ligase